MARKSISEARRQFSEMVQDAASEPQELLHHGDPVGAVIGVEDLEVLYESKRRKSSKTLALAFAELHRCADDSELVSPAVKRTNRPSTWPEVLDELSG